MHTDSIADYLTQIRNAISAKHRLVEIPASRLREEVTKVLMEYGYIRNYKVEGEKAKKHIKIALKYHPVTKMPAITYMRKISTPGLRKYTGKDNLPRVLNGLGIAIISTSKGIITDKQARKENIGGEVLCYVY